MKRDFAGRLLLSVSLALLLVPSYVWAEAGEALSSGFDESSAGGEEAMSDDVSYDEDSVIVVYDDAEGEARSEALAEGAEEELEDTGFVVEETLAEADDESGAMSLLSVPEGSSVEEAVEAAEDVDGVSYAQPDYTYELLEDEEEDEGASAEDSDGSSAEASSVPDDTYAGVLDTTTTNQYYLYGDELETYGTKGADVIDAWDYVTCDKNVTIAVFDTGANLSHVDLEDNILTDYAYDIYNGVSLEEEIANDASGEFNGDNYGHGTHVAGIAAATANNGTGIAGVSYNANLLVYKIFDDAASSPSTTTSQVVKAYSRMLELMEDDPDLNVRVVNMSLGMYDDPTESSDIAMHECIKEAREDGILTVCAGGNGLNGVPYTDSIYPADWDECLAVTTLDTDGTNYTSADFNEDKDISAPGRRIYSTYNGNSVSYKNLTGSSMAAPVVSGVAALLWTVDPDATVDEIVEVIESTATEIDDSDDEYARNSAGYNGVVSGSAGAINAEAAVVTLSEEAAAEEEAEALAEAREALQASVDSAEALLSSAFEEGSSVSGETTAALEETLAAAQAALAADDADAESLEAARSSLEEAITAYEAEAAAGFDADDDSNADDGVTGDDTTAGEGSSGDDVTGDDAADGDDVAAGDGSSGDGSAGDDDGTDDAAGDDVTGDDAVDDDATGDDSTGDGAAGDDVTVGDGSSDDDGAAGDSSDGSSAGSGSAELTDISSAKVTLADKTLTYKRGKAKKPAVTSVKLGGKKLPEGAYTVTYVNNKKIGTATVKVTGKSSAGYEGSVTTSFDIIPAKTKVLYAKTGKKRRAMKIRLAAKLGGVTYQIRYRVKGTKKWKTVSSKKQVKRFKKLKSGKKYQVKARTVKKVKGKTYASAWSKVKVTKRVK